MHFVYLILNIFNRKTRFLKSQNHISHLAAFQTLAIPRLNLNISHCRLHQLTYCSIGHYQAHLVKAPCLFCCFGPKAVNFFGAMEPAVEVSHIVCVKNGGGKKIQIPEQLVVKDMLGYKLKPTSSVFC